MHRTLLSILTPEDRATYAKWMRVVAVVYCASSGYEVGYGPGKDARAHVVMRTGLPER